jgi:hypothetical protein
MAGYTLSLWHYPLHLILAKKPRKVCIAFTVKQNRAVNEFGMFVLLDILSHFSFLLTSLCTLCQTDFLLHFFAQDLQSSCSISLRADHHSMLRGKQHNLDRKFFLFSEMELILNLLQQGTQS